MGKYSPTFWKSKALCQHFADAYHGFPESTRLSRARPIALNLQRMLREHASQGLSQKSFKMQRQLVLELTPIFHPEP
eukprot:1313065-Pyramimonas_sp.AAC.1